VSLIIRRQGRPAISGERLLQILVIDDSRSVRALIAHTLRMIDDTEVEVAADPRQALGLCEWRQFDLVLVDYEMPHMTGIEVAARLRERADYAAVPIVMVTSHIDRAVRMEAIGAGITEFLGKPFERVELQARVRNLLALRRAQIELSEYASGLAEAVERATARIAKGEEEIIWRLARAIEQRDGSTGCHVSRVATIASLIASELGLDAEHCRMIYLATPLHDVGKIGIPDAVLNKTGKLTDTEMAQMREHVGIGVRILEGGSSDLLRIAEAIAGGHHEKWDGSGYPNRIAGEAIPIEARVAAVADVFDALCSERPYKRAWTLDEAYREIVANSGSHFDPACVSAFQRLWPEIQAIMSADQAATTLIALEKRQIAEVAARPDHRDAACAVGAVA
jgi:putative two-component system response regulator